MHGGRRHSGRYICHSLPEVEAFSKGVVLLMKAQPNFHYK
jgi:hypothetical protein